MTTSLKHFIENKPLDKILYSLSILLILSLPISESIKQISFWLIFILFAYTLLRFKKRIKLDTINILIIIHLINCFISSILGVDFYESLNKSIDILRIVSIFIIFRELKITEKQLMLILNILFFSFNIVTIFAMYNYFFNGADFIKLHSVGSINRSSVYAMYVFCISSICWLNYKDKHFFFTALLASLYILLSGSRMVLFTYPAVIVLILLLNKKMTIKNIFYMIIISAIFLVITLFMFENSRLAEKITAGLNDIPRIQIWVSSIYIWMSHNVFFGIGIGNSIHFTVETYFAKDALTSVIDNAHNTYISILLEQGLIGLTSYLLFLFYVLKILFTRKDYLAQIGILIICSSMLMSFMNITFRYEFGLLFMIILALALNGNLGTNKNEKPTYT